MIKKFKNSITDEHFIIVGYEREYTKIFSETEGKIFMVKGIREDLEKIVDRSELPLIINTSLLMFKGKIIFNSFFTRVDIIFGNDIKK